MAATKLNMLQAFFQRLTPCAGKLPLQVVFVREFSTTDELMIKRRHISKWKNKFPDQVYFEGLAFLFRNTKLTGKRKAYHI